jgi:hypothetical protein
VLLEQLSFVASTEQARFYLNGIFIHADGDRLVLVACRSDKPLRFWPPHRKRVVNLASEGVLHGDDGNNITAASIRRIFRAAMVTPRAIDQVVRLTWQKKPASLNSNDSRLRANS